MKQTFTATCHEGHNWRWTYEKKPSPADPDAPTMFLPRLSDGADDLGEAMSAKCLKCGGHASKVLGEYGGYFCQCERSEIVVHFPSP